LSPHEAFEQLNAVISKEIESLWHNADTNNDTLFSRSDMDVIFVNYDHNSKYVFFSSKTHISFANFRLDSKIIRFFYFVFIRVISL